ncbi:hypothetical protein LX36DRAFT_365662 [Colletotrichum falcatum]|nr:hypothetical protein LX36DRAFT_365662 [Colletotrichum falcatum]
MDPQVCVIMSWHSVFPMLQPETTRQIRPTIGNPPQETVENGSRRRNMRRRNMWINQFVSLLVLAHNLLRTAAIHHHTVPWTLGRSRGCLIRRRELIKQTKPTGDWLRRAFRREVDCEVAVTHPPPAFGLLNKYPAVLCATKRIKGFCEALLAKLSRWDTRFPDALPGQTPSHVCQDKLPE